MTTVDEIEAQVANIGAYVVPAGGHKDGQATALRGFTVLEGLGGMEPLSTELLGPTPATSDPTASAGGAFRIKRKRGRR